MQSDNEGTKPPELEFAEGYEPYIDAFVRAYHEVEEIKTKEKALAFRKAQLHDTLAALRPLIFKQSWDINSLGLSDAIRFVFRSAKRPLSAIEVRSKLEDLGYKLEDHDNPLASIHTALKRMGDTNELYPFESEGKKKVFEPTPELKPAPEPPALPDFLALQKQLEMLKNSLGITD